MRYIRVLVLGILALMTAGCLGSGAIASFRSPNDYQRYSDATVDFLIVDADDNAHTYCSGFFVDDQTILTADHCARAALKYSIPRPPEEMIPLVLAFIAEADLTDTPMTFVMKYNMPQIGSKPEIIHEANVVYSDKEHDLAMVQLSSPAKYYHKVLEISNNDPVIGEEIVEVGHPQGAIWTLSWGRVSAIRSEINASNFAKVGPFIQIDATVLPGNSGGPVISLATGKVLGVISFSNEQGNGYAIHCNEVKRFSIEARAEIVRQNAEKIKKAEELKKALHQ